MNAQQFHAYYHAPRNGTNNFHFNRLYRGLEYSDGVREVASTGCYWLLDIVGTEVVKAMRGNDYPATLTVTVKDESATMTVSVAGMSTTASRKPLPLWCKRIPHTDMPAGEWTFLLQVESGILKMILPTEY